MRVGVRTMNLLGVRKRVRMRVSKGEKVSVRLRAGMEESVTLFFSRSVSASVSQCKGASEQTVI